MQTTSKYKERTMLMLVILFTFTLKTKAITNPTKCIRSCNGTTVNYPFGFSENCEFRLNCTSNGRMEFQGFDIMNITWNSIVLSISPNCSRPINQIHHLYGRNYALTPQNRNLDPSWVEFQAVQVGWWLTGTCQCHQYAYCSQVGTSGFRCRCRPGFTGDGFIDGEGCRKIRNVTNFEDNKIGRAYPGDELHSLIRLSSSKGNQCKCRGRRLLLVDVIIPFVVGFGLMSLILLSYNMLLKATNGFSNENLLGVGHFGSVYKGFLDLDKIKMVVAVKIISLDLKGATKSFMAECNALRMTRHRNLLKVVTACSSVDFNGNDFKAMVYEFMPNGNLQQWIHGKTLSLIQRVNIAIDVACALDYLHNYCDIIPIIHCDLKPNNILLDNDMVAHVGDFGLARFHLHARASYSSSLTVKGTPGYVAPEYGMGSMVSKEGDVYSYGIVLLELMTSKNPTDRIFKNGLDLHNYAKSATLPNQLINIVDPRLLDDGADDASEGNDGELLAENERKMKCIMSVVEIGVKCTVQLPQDRMRIEDAIEELQVTRDYLLKELHIIRARHFRDIAG